ncbi:GATA zinc finger domain-containing protein 15-like [Schistocerca americana]|uniref:GATA zinc finger domain-containing protein 15-like n=1 Tax=Schistocerca americana TaxID=7009 RepID=UPI001F502C54|nr:GATA zinc finger domain-containing protein 15-like [Schistocerca americana]
MVKTRHQYTMEQQSSNANMDTQTQSDTEINTDTQTHQNNLLHIHTNAERSNSEPNLRDHVTSNDAAGASSFCNQNFGAILNSILEGISNIKQDNDEKFSQLMTDNAAFRNDIKSDFATLTQKVDEINTRLSKQVDDLTEKFENLELRQSDNANHIHDLTKTCETINCKLESNTHACDEINLKGDNPYKKRRNNNFNSRRNNGNNNEHKAKQKHWQRNNNTDYTRNGTLTPHFNQNDNQYYVRQWQTPQPPPQNHIQMPQGNFAQTSHTNQQVTSAKRNQTGDWQRQCPNPLAEYADTKTRQADRLNDRRQLLL